MYPVHGHDNDTLSPYLSIFKRLMITSYLSGSDVVMITGIQLGKDTVSLGLSLRDTENSTDTYTLSCVFYPDNERYEYKPDTGSILVKASIDWVQVMQMISEGMTGISGVSAEVLPECVVYSGGTELFNLVGDFGEHDTIRRFIQTTHGNSTTIIVYTGSGADVVPGNENTDIAPVGSDNIKAVFSDNTLYISGVYRDIDTIVNNKYLESDLSRGILSINGLNDKGNINIKMSPLLAEEGVFTITELG